MRQKRILVVDDDEEVTRNFIDVFSVNGFVGDVLNDPFNALSIIKNDPEKYQVVICDIRMPGMNGVEMAHEILQIKASIKIVLISDDEKDNYYISSRNQNKSISFSKKPKSKRDIVTLLGNDIMN